MHWIYLLSSDTKRDNLYIFKLEVNPLWQRDKEVTWGSPFWETSIEITVLWSSDMSVQIAYQLYSGMILEEVIKQMVVIKKMRWWWWWWWWWWCWCWCWCWCWWWWCCSLKNPMIFLTKNNTDVAGNGKKHQVKMTLSCLFLPLGFYGNAISLSWSESWEAGFTALSRKSGVKAPRYAIKPLATMTWPRHRERSPMHLANRWLTSDWLIMVDDGDFCLGRGGCRFPKLLNLLHHVYVWHTSIRHLRKTDLLFAQRI